MFAPLALLLSAPKYFPSWRLVESSDVVYEWMRGLA